MCGHLNEDGTLFCDQCVSDLADVPPMSAEEAAAAAPMAEAAPLAEAAPMAEEPAPDLGVEPLAEQPAALGLAEPPMEPGFSDAGIPEAVPEPISEAPLSGAGLGVPLSRLESPPGLTPSKVLPTPSKVAPPPTPSKVAPPVSPSKAVPTPARVAPPSPAPPLAPTRPLAPAAPPAASAPPPAPPLPRARALPDGAKPKLVVVRGLKTNLSYPICAGKNFIGRSGEQPVDIDLSDQEPADNTWTSRQHACITFENNMLHIEDLKSANGTFVNRGKLIPGQKRPLEVGDIVQVGRVHMKVTA
jgi:hypothetical protein